ncbi:NUDIX domain-containing protein [Kitasatospora paracochleata]|uniref:8-oxo-dGTP diphosphatase n=1 Tax=Kitasatospora paracochleata TaxID=58354 RepID=A0ABT1J645_9ACTN|nr:NUDIX domain-containing protein [Kitasatospora paracochleata]MCP2312176.1 8-oxo-dGTP diphosphatase [Kitasatospora paracochleata]
MSLSAPGDEQDWLAAYDPREYPPVAVTVDVVALTLRHGTLHVLLVERGTPPHLGRLALPGGFLRAGREDLATAAARELAEETGLTELPRVHLEQLGSYGAPDRDPRMHVVSVAHLAFAPDLPDPQAGSDAAAAAWHPVDTLDPAALAFDHARILADALDRARAKLEYTPLAAAFLGPDFTIPELRAVYESVWGDPLHPGNFHRKVLSVPGFLRPTGDTTPHGSPRGGPRARRYRLGDATRLHPPLLRPAPDGG